MESLKTKKDYEKRINQINSWFDQLLTSKVSTVIPTSQPQPKKGLKYVVLESFWFRLFIIFYVLFSIFLTSAHFLSWLLSAETKWQYQRTYDSDEPYSLISNMSHGLKMSKMFSQGHYNALTNIEPYWLKANQVPNPMDVTFYTTVTPNTWRDLAELANNWEGPISATLHVSTNEKETIKSKMEYEYKTKPELFRHVDIHLIETPERIEKGASIIVPLNVERNLARIYARTRYIAEIPTNVFLNSDFHQNWIQNKKEYTHLLSQGDMLVIPLFKMMNDSKIPPTIKNELLADNNIALHYTHFELNDGPTEIEKWKEAQDIYKVTQYRMDYEPIVIQSKDTQSWCSERFVYKKSACLLPSYFAGNNFFVLPNDFAIQKPEHEQMTAISYLDKVIEKRLYAKFYWEQCVFQGRQLDALNLWETKKSAHIRQQCSRVIQNWDSYQQSMHSDRFPHFVQDNNKTTNYTNTKFSSIGYDEREKRTYELIVCQQPLHARMCGFGEKDRRPIDPPPIVQLIVRQEGQDMPVDVQTLQIPFFVLHVTLWSDDRSEERNIISNPPKCTRVLMGSLVSSPSLLKNPQGEQGLYFAFPDLSIRTEGRYTLRFSLMKLVNSDFQENAKSKIVAQVFSDPFTVYSAKKFPGMTESTELSKTFAKQGLKIPIRNDVRARKTE
ncbi:velvet factor-domain-containing protein [Cokeromyces recurvatus]|uniref:velvet factor-domain-containing protein n=1 Tax=Cokeromyces recurvatus TaxID=90255 RepID=UPI00222082DC|nr:velvet factor-domain-containing protein [Cokeromyces recurvatus]KAI7901618.1 velvet factor-domain-containing protein [Cokeromyces recurvatus]